MQTANETGNLTTADAAKEKMGFKVTPFISLELSMQPIESGSPFFCHQNGKGTATL